MPPLTCIVSPVMYEEESDDKNATEFATSSPDPNLDIGIRDVKIAFTLSKILSVILVSVSYTHLRAHETDS